MLLLLTYLSLKYLHPSNFVTRSQLYLLLDIKYLHFQSLLECFIIRTQTKIQRFLKEDIPADCRNCPKNTTVLINSVKTWSNLNYI
jgi:hypothetical protein